MKIPNRVCVCVHHCISLARIVSEDSQQRSTLSPLDGKSSKDS